MFEHRCSAVARTSCTSVCTIARTFTVIYNAREWVPENAMEYTFLKSVLDDWEPVNTESSRSVIFSISALRISGGGWRIVRNKDQLTRSQTYFIMNCQKWVLLTASQCSDTNKGWSYNDCKNARKFIDAERHQMEV